LFSLPRDTKLETVQLSLRNNGTSSVARREVSAGMLKGFLQTGRWNRFCIITTLITLYYIGMYLNVAVVARSNSITTHQGPEPL
jgi:hypothetical protein